MKTVLIKKGHSGIGDDMYLYRDTSKVILSLTGKSIDPVAKKLSEMLDMPIVNGFDAMPDDKKILCVVINCGGSLRCGIYPQKRIKTINVLPTGAMGPLAKYITEDIYISDVSNESLSLIETIHQSIETDEAVELVEPLPAGDASATASASKDPGAKPRSSVTNTALELMTRFATSIGNFVSLLYASARESVELCIKNVIPFMAFISVLIALVQETAIGQWTGNALSPLAGSLTGLFVIAIICGLPFISPILAPGAAIAQVVGVLVGTLIGSGAVSPLMALPALFAINVQVGADFIPVGLSMQEAKEKTIRLGVPSFLLSRMITAPLAVAIGYLFSFGLFN
ncbi:PTS glucitol/sorbitol transporter subunit IIB [[Enterobacter] lignolyticus]|uniref:Protein-N(Pi)-phosphohistidine--sugar phosphotransferase n=1 Tax=Enterobacter lignolyticus (strain SCF1) TaxID=701347 RepID=E3GB82_ENTLS|nr:PTS glucitol/sorbitol transporter subunit IIB [[Enterobacter] lignolyticus]ADO47751.1 Protein-N(pi)-phosphohistidine--sugar phosphotransferase [[Enterobacter] lignolyticus SCF1]